LHENNTAPNRSQADRRTARQEQALTKPITVDNNQSEYRFVTPLFWVRWRFSTPSNERFVAKIPLDFSGVVS